MRQAHAFVLCFVVLAASSPAEDSIALLRSGARVEIIDISPAGITLAPDHDRPGRVDSLSGVKDVTGPLSPKFAEIRTIATDLWRAIARLNREDEGGAEPLLHQLWLRTAGVSGPTRAEIAAGLAACRVHRGALATAIDPWVEWIRQSTSLSPDQLASQRARLGISDAADPWIETLPPIWTDSIAVRALASQPCSSVPESAFHPTGDDLALIYAVAARRDTGQPWQADAVRALKDPAWANLAGEMVLAESDSTEVRAEARQRLISRLGADVPLWKKTWIRLAIGRSFLLEPETDERRTGVLNLLWVASRVDAPAPLVAIALVSATHGLLLLSDDEGARATLEELERRFVGDVILDSPGLAGVRRTLSQSVPSATPPAPPTQQVSPPAKE